MKTLIQFSLMVLFMFIVTITTGDMFKSMLWTIIAAPIIMIIGEEYNVIIKKIFGRLV